MADGGTETDRGRSDTAGGAGTGDETGTGHDTGTGDVAPALLSSVAAPMIQILGLFLTVGAFLAWRAGGDVELSTVALVLGGVVVVVGAAFAWRGDTLLGLVVSGRPLAVTAAFVVLFGVILAAVLFLPTVHLTLSTAPVAIVGAVSLLGPLVEAAQHRVSGPGRRGDGPAAPDRLFNSVLAYLVWQVPLAAALLVGALWVADVAV